MIDFTTIKKAWALLDARERRNSLIVVFIAVLSAAASTAMVASVMPFLSVLSDPSEIEANFYLALAYKNFEFRSDYGFLIFLGLASLVVIVSSILIQVIKTYVLNRFAMMLVHAISCKLVSRYLSQNYEYFLNRNTGDMGTRVLTEAREAVIAYLRPVIDIVTSTLTILVLIGFLFWVEPYVAIGAFSVLGGIFSLTYIISRTELRRQGVYRVEANKECFRLTLEALSGIKYIKTSGSERTYIEQFSRPSKRLAKARTRANVLSQIPTNVIQGVALCGVIVICLLLVDDRGYADGTALKDVLPILGLFAFAGQRLMPELSRLYLSGATLQSGAAAIDSVYEELIGEQAVIPQVAPQQLGCKKSFELYNVSYRYPGAAKLGLDDVTVKVCAGEKIGVVGSTGAGKTTLADIILGLLSPISGQLVSDGIPIGGENLRRWQRTVGYVPQEVFLTDASVASNIAFAEAEGEMDMEKVKRAARIANIDDFIAKDLSLGYETIVGERGVRLSGGQRQRIGIARALYQDADLIVFDEATSALDNSTEASVIDAINRLPGEKTIIMIAHRLSTVKLCDRIIVLEQGRIVGCGSWEELIAENEAFQKIATRGAAE